MVSTPYFFSASVAARPANRPLADWLAGTQDGQDGAQGDGALDLMPLALPALVLDTRRAPRRRKKDRKP